MTGDPRFLNLAGPDGILGVDLTTGADSGQDDDFHLQNGSPGVAAGDPSSDYLPNRRPLAAASTWVPTAIPRRPPRSAAPA